jgi:hypothetical protein
MPIETPFSRSYWVVPGKFLAGYYPGDPRMDVVIRKMSALLACGIRCIINLMEPDERDHDGLPFVDYEPVFRSLAEGGPPVRCYRMPIRDLDTPSRDDMIRILDRIDGVLKQDIPVYVHCWGGRGRTGTVVGCWLVRHGIAEGKNALEMIRELRCFDPKAHRPSPEMPEQIRMILSWNKGQ